MQTRADADTALLEPTGVPLWCAQARATKPKPKRSRNGSRRTKQMGSRAPENVRYAEYVSADEVGIRSRGISNFATSSNGHTASTRK